MIQCAIFKRFNKNTNGMRTNKSKRLRFLVASKGRIVVLVGAALLFAASPFVYADSIQQQINDLQNKNAQTQQSVDGLQLQANNYQDAINKLQQQIDAIQGAIAANEAKQADLQQQIVAAQAELDHERSVLANAVKTMYVDGTPTTIEELASSNNLSDFVDKQEYRTVVQNQIQDTVKKIAALQAQLQSQKVQVDQLLGTQRQQQAQLDSDQQQQNNLLAMNQDQQNTYNQQIQSNKSKISSLQAEQVRINAANSRTLSVAASGGSGGACDNGSGNGGYPMPWCDAWQDSVTTSGGFPNRECTSFGYWYFTSMEGKSLYVTGDAKYWVYTANRPVDQTPEDGAIAVSTAGPYGHIMIVKAVPGESYAGVTAPPGYVITISMNDDYAGHFYVRERSASSLYYIH